jgi:F-type H+-transporting ATPase subunit b
MALDSTKLAYAGAFVIFAGVLYRYVGAKIVGMLDTYSANVRKQLDEAQTLREDAQALLASYQRKQHDAQLEAREILARTKQEAAALREQALAELDRDLARREQAALDRVAGGAARARHEVQAAAIASIISTLETLIRERGAQADNSTLQQLAAQVPALAAARPETRA